MGFIDRKSNYNTGVSNLYSFGSSKTLLVIGLGNYGKEFKDNRHNIGFMAVDDYAKAKDFSNWTLKKDLKSEISVGRIGETRVLLAKPTTMMNLSGEAVASLMKFYKIAASELIVVHDELDVDFGAIRVRTGGSSAGNNGIKSIIAHLGEEFERIRVGIGPKTPKQIDSADFVLADFSAQQSEKLPKILREINALIDERTTGKIASTTINVVD